MSIDAAFKNEEEKGHSMRGALFIRAFGDYGEDLLASGLGNLLDFGSRSQRRVAWSSKRRVA